MPHVSPPRPPLGFAAPGMQRLPLSEGGGLAPGGMVAAAALKPRPFSAAGGGHRLTRTGVAVPEVKEVGISVVVRIRPPDVTRDSPQSVKMDVKNKKQLTVYDGNTSKGTFNFDRVIEDHVLQQKVYKDVAHPMVREVLEGYNCTIFAYFTPCLSSLT